MNAGGLGGDFTHFNGIDCNEEFEQILVSVRGLDEIWVILRRVLRSDRPLGVGRDRQ